MVPRREPQELVVAGGIVEGRHLGFVQVGALQQGGDRARRSSRHQSLPTLQTNRRNLLTENQTPTPTHTAICAKRRTARCVCAANLAPLGPVTMRRTALPGGGNAGGLVVCTSLGRSGSTRAQLLQKPEVAACAGLTGPSWRDGSPGQAEPAAPRQAPKRARRSASLQQAATSRQNSKPANKQANQQATPETNRCASPHAPPPGRTSPASHR